MTVKPPFTSETEVEPSRVVAMVPPSHQDQRHPPRHDERRRYARTTVLWSGGALAGAHVHPCVVLNISAGGTKLRFESPVDLPKQFRLTVERFGVFAVETAQTNGHQVGVQFVDGPDEICRVFESSIPRIRSGAAGAHAASAHAAGAH